MKLKDIGEFGFIDKISKGCLIRKDNVIKAIGDDAAAFRSEANTLTILTTDLLVERVHFLRATTSGFNLGFKALAVNLSDIAAMGATAREAFVSIAVPDDCPVAFLEDLYHGMQSLAREFEVNILGGDTTRSANDLVINISVVGSVPENEMLCRDGAQAGDMVCSTGYLGDSRAGLHLILGNHSIDSDDADYLFKAHILPRPYLREGRFLARHGAVHAAIDISDGLSADLGHILRSSGVGARLYADKLPLSKPLRAFCDEFNFDPVEYALAGGEDYTLLFTVAPDMAESLSQHYRQTFGVPLYCIGEISVGADMEIIFADGKNKTITPSGWDHFKADSVS